MLKRLFWLALIAAGGLIVWLWRQRQEDFASMTPQFAPPMPFPPPSSAKPAGSSPASEPAAPSAEASADTQVTVSAPVEATDEPQPSPVPPAEAAYEAAIAAATAPEAAATSADEPAAAAPVVEHATETSDLGDVVGYCVRCKTKRPISGAHEETTESGRRAARGTCPVCGANMFTFLKDEPD
jgi:uncharacterized protein DUF5679